MIESYTQETLFPVAELPFYVNIDLAKDKLSWHTHDFLELVLVARGVGVHYFPGNANCGIMQGDFFMVQTGTPHYYENRRELVIYNIMLAPKPESEFLDEVQELPLLKELSSDGRRKCHLPLEIRCKAEKLLNMIIGEMWLRPVGWRVNARGLFLEVMALLGRAFTSYKSEGHEYIDSIQKAVSFMEEHFGEPLTLEEIRRQANMNLNYFCEAFQHEIGTSPWNYLLRLRLDRVKRMLIDSDRPIAEIADTCGFCDQSYMSRLFRKYEAVTPRRYRNANKGMLWQPNPPTPPEEP